MPALVSGHYVELVPPATAIPTTTEHQQNYNDEDQERGVIHLRLLSIVAAGKLKLIRCQYHTSASAPSRTPASLANCGSGYADTINSYPEGTAALADLRDHAVRLMKRCGRHGQRRCRDGGCKATNLIILSHVMRTAACDGCPEEWTSSPPEVALYEGIALELGNQVVPQEGFEPPTPALRMRCSTD